MKHIGAPKSGDAIAVAAATEPVGATVGQVGKILGCRIVGIAKGVLRKRIRFQGFIIFDDFAQFYPKFAKEMGASVEEGRIKYRGGIIEGLENAPPAFIGLLKGENFGNALFAWTLTEKG